eukprot:GCRY01001486.1.p1 GENE.GCRY01001486.1~~GCRY01001486.1.p1  ORF type:complete len:304 (-),score=78.37 GCRY01001486.1:283-1194(-)
MSAVSFLNPLKEKAEEGDIVVLYGGYDQMAFVQLKHSEIYNGKRGSFHHDDIIGTPYGKKVTARTSKGWLFLLSPSPELWTASMKTRTQILFVADISMVCMYFDLKPGSVVVESGTGSGSLTHALARGVAPSGHVYTFEFNEFRANEARADFERHGFGDLVTVTHRDVLSDGFTLEDGRALENIADGVFLDLPSPWIAVEAASKALKTLGVMCSFSPCIEQVQRTCALLHSKGFLDIRTIECLLRRQEVQEVAATHSPELKEFVKLPFNVPETPMYLTRTEALSRGHTGYLTFAVKPASPPPA